MAARAIAVVEKMPTPQVEAAFLTGMLHDVGRVVYATRSAPTMGEFANANDTIEQIAQHHAEVGAYLLGLWGFPSNIVAAVALHHTPSRRADAGFDLTVLVHVADRLVHAQGANSTGPFGLEVEEGLLDSLGLLDRVPKWSEALTVLDSEQAAL
jgi:HD-like signal output (HDOD) protein